MRTTDVIFVHAVTKPIPEISFSEVKEGDDDIEYIRKDTLLEWLRKEADKSYNSFAREELGLEARHRGLDFEEVIRKIKSL